MKTRRKGPWGIILILIVIILTGIILKFIFNEPVSEITTAVTAIVGVLAILYQLKKEHDISRAEFVFNMNSSFAENTDINTIYKKLKENRDNKATEFTDDDGRLMGDYVMYFEIMSYLIEENIVGIKMVDELFAGRFFIFVNNLDVQKFQLQYSGVMPKIFDLYCIWYNYRKKQGLPNIYPDNQLHIKLKEWFFIDENDFLKPNTKYINEALPKIVKR